VSDNPLIYLLDTPGILTPNVPDIETGLRLALCGKTLNIFALCKVMVNYSCLVTYEIFINFISITDVLYQVG
jgi:ribosome biogenesis GTPase A